MGKELLGECVCGGGGGGGGVSSSESESLLDRVFRDLQEE